MNNVYGLFRLGFPETGKLYFIFIVEIYQGELWDVNASKLAITREKSCFIFMVY